MWAVRSEYQMTSITHGSQQMSNCRELECTFPRISSSRRSGKFQVRHKLRKYYVTQSGSLEFPECPKVSLTVKLRFTSILGILGPPSPTSWLKLSAHVCTKAHCERLCVERREKFTENGNCMVLLQICFLVSMLRKSVPRRTFETNLSASQKEEMANQAAYEDLKAAKLAEIAAGNEQKDTKTQELADTDSALAQRRAASLAEMPPPWESPPSRETTINFRL